jgi:hypothetical protein
LTIKWLGVYHHIQCKNRNRKANRSLRARLLASSVQDIILKQNGKQLRSETAIYSLDSNTPLIVREVDDLWPADMPPVPAELVDIVPLPPLPPLPADTMPLTFAFPNKSLIVQDFSVDATLGFVRASLDYSREVLFDRIKVEADDSIRVGAVPNIEN